MTRTRKANVNDFVAPIVGQPCLDKHDRLTPGVTDEGAGSRFSRHISKPEQIFREALREEREIPQD